VQEFLLRVELPLGLRLPGGGSISQEVRPEDKMAANSQNTDIITLSLGNVVKRFCKCIKVPN
jgi:hypothetical protein